MAMKRRTATTHPGERAGMQTFILALAAMLAVLFAVSCRSREARQAGAKLPEEQELRGKIAMLSRRAQVLSAEISLAKNPAPYLAVDLANRKIGLKVQGHSLRSFAIRKIQRTGGSSLVARTWMETEARPLESPVRAKVVPGSGEATTSSLATRDPWGPKRMPSDYDLVCKGNQALRIRSLLSDQSRSRFTRWLVNAYLQVRDWARDTLGGRKSSYRESIEIWLDEDDAQLLFWSLPKEFGILVLDAS
jgi:hypothetical protein